MKKIICLFVFLAAFLSAQTFPNAIPSAASLSDPYTATPTTLSADVTATGLYLDVTSTAGIKYGEVIRIDDEYLQVCATYTTGTRIRICPSGRGHNGTTAAEHLTGAVLEINHQRAQFNRLATEVSSIANTLGVHLVNVGQVVKVTVPKEALTAAGLTQPITVLELPANAIVTGIRVKHSEAFATTDLSAMTVSLGINGTPAAYTIAYDVFAAATATAVQDTPLFKGVSAASHVILATFTATGANLGDGAATSLTAGSVDIYVRYFILP